MKFLIAGGGTGGHVYPALAIAKSLEGELEKINQSATIEFVGTPRGIENKIIPEAGYELHLLQVGRLNSNVSLGERIKTLLQLPLSLIKAALLVFKFKPNMVIGVGGYASGPALLSAKLLGYKTCIWEPNAYPGMANRILSKYVDHGIFVFPEAQDHLPIKDFEVLPMPVRSEIEKAPPRIPQTSDFCVLIFGGSQGARAINNIVAEAICSGHPDLKQVRFVHQTGRIDFEKIKAMYEQSPHAAGKVECLEYLHDMPRRYNWADLVVARSGTGTLSELAAMSKASLLVPLPTAADNHQYKNAQVLADAQAAVLIEQKDFTVQSFVSAIKRLEKNSEELEEMGKKVRQFYQKNSSEKIGQKLLSWTKK